MARYAVERALWDDTGTHACGAVTVIETDNRDEAIAAADKDHEDDPNGQTVVYEDTCIIYEARG